MSTGNLILLILQCLLMAKSFADQSKADLLERIIEERKLRSAGYHEFEHSTIFEVNESKIKKPVNDMSIRTKRSTGDTFDLQFAAFGEVFHLHLSHKQSVLHPDAKIVVEKDNIVTEWTGEHPDCFLTGEVPSHGGTVSASYCNNNLIGGLSTSDHAVHFENISTHIRNDDGKEHTVILIARKPHTHKTDTIPHEIEPEEIEAENPQQHSRRRRSIQSTSFDVEMAVYTDAAYTALFPTTNTVERIRIMIIKYNGVQMEWSRVGMLGFNVTLQIKYMHFYESDPAAYNNTGGLMGVRMKSFCDLKQGSLPYDAFYLHIGAQGLDVSGRAELGSICKQPRNCACDNILGSTDYVGTAHEIGHNFGMQHDQDICPDAEPGNMGSYGAGWSTCSAEYMYNFLNGSDVSCLWEVNIPSSDVPASLQGLVLVPELPGQQFTPDEICEEKYGTGFRYREYPLLGICQQYSCVDYNPGSTYGQMFKETKNIPGQYCNTGQICFKLSCVTWATAKQTDLTVRAGAWGDWGSWTSCSRLCGTGVQYRRRKCDNPTPKNSPTCVGEEYDATPCNTTPCLADSSSVSTLKRDRASEVCATLVTNGVINSTLYQSKGNIYSAHQYGQCEVSCDPVTGYTSPTYTRFGLAPDGTPCTGTLDDWDSNNWPRRPGYYHMCIQGLCKRFGCDKLEGSQYDECGVCGGDNSTCDVYAGTDTTQQPDWGSTRVLANLPVGTYNIQFWFPYFDMKQNFLELWTKDGAYVLADSQTYIFTYPEPVSFGGAYWYYSYTGQHLYTKGPLTTPAVIKFYKKKTFSNTGVNYAYSVPLSARTCSGTCENGGTYNSTICACYCPSNYYGNTCASSCNTICANGGTVEESTCTCQCTERSYGTTCTNCKYPYEGEGCGDCKVNSCQNCGTFNATTCRCDCLDGYGGLQCEHICQDSGSTCAADVAAGKCESDNINMEQNCMASCNVCVIKAGVPATMVECEGSTLAPSTTTTTPTTTTTVATTTTAMQCPWLEAACNGTCVNIFDLCENREQCDQAFDLSRCAGSSLSKLTIGLLLWPVIAYLLCVV